jgi:hypothetical protein
VQFARSKRANSLVLGRDTQIRQTAWLWAHILKPGKQTLNGHVRSNAVFAPEMILCAWLGFATHLVRLVTWLVGSFSWLVGWLVKLVGWLVG